MRHDKVALSRVDGDYPKSSGRDEEYIPDFAGGKFQAGYYKIRGSVRYVGRCVECETWTSWVLRKERPLKGLCKSCAAKEAANQRWKLAK